MLIYQTGTLPGVSAPPWPNENHQDQIQVISHASRQLKKNEKNYTRFLLETAAAAWGMDNFNECLKGSRFTLYKDLTTETMLGTTQHKTLNWLQTMMTEHDFELQDRQSSDLPDFLKKTDTGRDKVPRSRFQQNHSCRHDQHFNQPG